MKACLYAGYQDNEWIWEMLPGKSPAELPVCGKTWARHAIDMCSLLETTDVFIADCFFYPELAQRLGDGSYWSTSIHYLPSTDVREPFQLLKQHENELPTDDLLIFWGQVLPDIPDIHALFDELRPVPKIDDALPNGIYLIRDGVLNECVCPLHRMDSVKNYFDLNMRMLNAPGIYNLPGFSPDSSFDIGRNVITLFGCHLTPPLIVQDNSCLGRGSILAGETIIGGNVLIDDNSYLKRAVILDNTYIGRKMHIENKIVAGRTVIDVETGVHVDLEDSFLAGDTNRSSTGGIAFIESLIALWLLVALLPSQILALIFGKWMCRLPYFKYVRQIYPVLPRVITGHANLVRNGVRDVNYAFRFSDQWLVVPDEHYRDLADLYYSTHRSTRAILAVVIGTLFKRMCTLTDPNR